MLIISSFVPVPVHAGDSVTVNGVDVGICTAIFIQVSTSVAGPAGPAQSVVTKTAQLTRLGQSRATFTMPDFALTGRVNGLCKVQYTLNSVAQYSAEASVDIDPAVAIGPPVVAPPPSYGYGIPDGRLEAPLAVQRWKFSDPADPNPATNVYLHPINPNKMTSPHPSRKINAAYTTAVDGQVLLTEGSPIPTQWSFGGEIFNAQHYDLLRSWVYDRRRRIIVTDHFGRPITCVFEKFDATPALTRIRQGKYWRHTYTITAIVIDVGRPTVIPA